MIYELEGRALSALIMLETEGGAAGGREGSDTHVAAESLTNKHADREREKEGGRQVQSEMESDSEMIKAAI